ncbi:MAG: M48 family metallopeptidase, partial [Candidatus Sericytochromatia bacterium]|nr:M48 family metallopeptidase [Candidatus Sericytochromatia bacterium]
MEQRWSGRYVDGASPVRRQVSLTLEPRGLVITGLDGAATVHPYGTLRVLTGDLPGEVATLALGPGPTPPQVEVRDPSILAAIAERAPRGRVRGPRSQKNLALLATAVLGLAAAGLVALVGWVLPAVAEGLARHVPPGLEARLGMAVAGKAVAEAGSCPDGIKQQAVQAILDRLVQGSGTPYRYRVHVVHDASVNALAAPGGHIIVFEGLLAAMPSPEALAGVLAHEMQHIERRHVTRALLRDTATSLLLSSLTGDAGMLGTAINAAGGLGRLALSRADEAEADRLGMARILAVGLDPAGMVAAYRVLARQGGLGPRAERALRLVST